jgi:hypothetical protein
MARLVLLLQPGIPVSVDEVLDLPDDLAKPEGVCFLLAGLADVVEDRKDGWENHWVLGREAGLPGRERPRSSSEGR